MRNIKSKFAVFPNFYFFFISLLCISLSTQCAFAQANFPDKPIKLIVGYPPGGSGDFVTRGTADELGKELGVAVLVDNKPGAGGSIAAELVAKSPADGYTLAVLGPHALIKALFPKLSFDPDKDLISISNLATGSMIICVNPKTPFKTLKDLIDFAKSHPQQLFSAASGNGSTPHLAAALFESTAGVKFTTIQFKGGGAAAQSTMSGDTQVMFATMPTILPYVKSEKLRGLAVTGASRDPSMPDLPSISETLPGFDVKNWIGLFAPAGTPPAIVKKLHDEVSKIMQQPAVQKKLESEGAKYYAMTPEAFGVFQKKESVRWGKIIKSAGIKPE